MLFRKVTSNKGEKNYKIIIEYIKNEIFFSVKTQTWTSLKIRVHNIWKPPSGLLVEFLKQFSSRKKAVRQFFDGFIFQTFGAIFEAIFFEKKCDTSIFWWIYLPDFWWNFWSYSWMQKSCARGCQGPRGCFKPQSIAISTSRSTKSHGIEQLIQGERTCCNKKGPTFYWTKQLHIPRGQAASMESPILRSIPFGTW